MKFVERNKATESILGKIDVQKWIVFLQCDYMHIITLWPLFHRTLLAQLLVKYSGGTDTIYYSYCLLLSSIRQLKVRSKSTMKLVFVILLTIVL